MGVKKRRNHRHFENGRSSQEVSFRRTSFVACIKRHRELFAAGQKLRALNEDVSSIEEVLRHFRGNSEAQRSEDQGAKNLHITKAMLKGEVVSKTDDSASSSNDFGAKASADRKQLDSLSRSLRRGIQELSYPIPTPQAKRQKLGDPNDHPTHIERSILEQHSPRQSRDLMPPPPLPTHAQVHGDSLGTTLNYSTPKHRHNNNLLSRQTVLRSPMRPATSRDYQSNSRQNVSEISPRWTIDDQVSQRALHPSDTRTRSLHDFGDLNMKPGQTEERKFIDYSPSPVRQRVRRDGDRETWPTTGRIPTVDSPRVTAIDSNSDDLSWHRLSWLDGLERPRNLGYLGRSTLDYSNQAFNSDHAASPYKRSISSFLTPQDAPKDLTYRNHHLLRGISSGVGGGQYPSPARTSLSKNSSSLGLSSHVRSSNRSSHFHHTPHSRLSWLRNDPLASSDDRRYDNYSTDRDHDHCRRPHNTVLDASPHFRHSTSSHAGDGRRLTPYFG